jgi:choline kinase
MQAALIVMAAGLGSRYGGIKQIAGVGPKGEILMEYAIFDALEAGFDRIILVVKPEILHDVKNLCGDRLSAITDVQYAIQDFTSIPHFCKVPANRTKPFGTVHAVLCAAPYIDRPFAVINSDDYYGKNALRKMYDGLKALSACSRANMVGYRLKNTVSQYGAVTRGICRRDNGKLRQITETYNICVFPDGTIRDTTASSDGEELDPEALVSMNFWGFTPWIIGPMKTYFYAFLRGLNPTEMSRECLLPIMVDDMIQAGVVDVDVLDTDDSWFGMTYKDDREKTMQALAKLHEAGAYPATLR